MPRELPIARLRLVAAVVLLAVALLVGARKLLSAGTAASVPLPPVGTSATAPAPTPVPPARRVVVDVVGAVRRPGLYRFARGARVADAVARAGGTTRRAALEQVNLAAPLADGEQVVVPVRGQVGGAAATGSAGGGPVDLNSATVEQLDALPGVGPVTAQKIVDYRQQHGAFTSLAELDAIPGIGPARIDQLKGLVVP